MRKTTILEKLIPSTINAAVIMLIALPFLGKISFLHWKYLVVGLFLLYNLIMLAFNANRCFGMVYHDTHWAKKVWFLKELIYIVLYSASFATLFIWIWFPLDLFLANMFLLQLPFIVITKTTFHAYVSGKGSTVTARRK